MIEAELELKLTDIVGSSIFFNMLIIKGGPEVTLVHSLMRMSLFVRCPDKAGI